MYSSVSDLYGINVRPVAPFGSTSRKAYVDPALLHRHLPDELLFEVSSGKIAAPKGTLVAIMILQIFMYVLNPFISCVVAMRMLENGMTKRRGVYKLQSLESY